MDGIAQSVFMGGNAMLTSGAIGKHIGWEGWTSAISCKVNCQRFTITDVSFSASWTHKHDGDYASVLQNNIC